MLNTLDLKCFLTLARTLNFTRTAEALFLSQQAVSQRISRMEQDIGFPLFIRSRSFVKLTRAGERCFAFLAPLEEEGRKLFEECRQAFCQQCKTLRVGYQNMLNWGAILSHAQDAFQKEFPEIETVGELFDSVVLVEHLKAGTVDMIVIYDRFAPKMDGLEKLELFHMPLLLMVSGKNPRVSPDATYLDFAQEPFIEDVFGGESLENTMARARRTASRCGLSPSDYIIVPTRDSANMAAESGRGVIVGTCLSLAYSASNVSVYPTLARETLICLWRAEQENIFVQKYAKCLQKAYRCFPPTDK